MMKKAAPKKTGRPTKRTPSVIARIIEGLSEGTPLTILCKSDDMPGIRTVYDWMDADEQLSADIARAREMGWDAIAVDCLTIADDGTNDFVKREKADGSVDEAFDKDHVLRSKLRVETRLKLLAKWDPKRYGELIKHAGADGEGPVRMVVSSEDAAL